MPKRVLVTGGATGIGAAIVRALAGDGFDVTFTYNSSSDRAAALIEALGGEAPGAAVAAHPLDLADAAAVDAFADAVAAGEGAFAEGLYGFVHNAGRPYDSLAAMVDRAAAAPTMEINFWSMTRLVRGLVRGMTAARAGRIVLIGSLVARRASQGNAIYAASKAALAAYCATLAVEVARRGVTANVVAPGYVDTDMMRRYDGLRDTLAAQIPARRYAAPEEVAAAVSFLMSARAGYITGTTLTVDGGLGASLGVTR